MAADYKVQCDNLLSDISAHVVAEGPGIVANVAGSAKLLLAWMDYLRNAVATGVADDLLNGAHAAVVEVAGCLAIGLVRPAVFSLRAQIDMLLAWTFFKDHPVEWRHAEWTGNGRLRGLVLKDLKLYIPAFRTRRGLLTKHRQRASADPYRLLSAHVHSQTGVTVPARVDLRTLVESIARCEDAVRLQFEVAEYLSDILVACYADRWIDLPTPVKQQVRARLSEKDLRVLCTTLLPKHVDKEDGDAQE
jgi:hypothetical protein